MYGRVPEADASSLHSVEPELAVLRLRARSSTIVLTRSNAHVRGLFSAVRGSLVVQEGGDFVAAYTALGAAEAASGDPRGLANAVIDLLRATCRGLDTGIRDQLAASLLADRLDRGHRQRIARCSTRWHPSM